MRKIIAKAAIACVTGLFAIVGIGGTAMATTAPANTSKPAATVAWQQPTGTSTSSWNNNCCNNCCNNGNGNCCCNNNGNGNCCNNNGNNNCCNNNNCGNGNNSTRL